MLAAATNITSLPHSCFSHSVPLPPLLSGTPLQLCLKREVLARERVQGGHKERFHKELAASNQPGVQPFTVLQGGLAR